MNNKLGVTEYKLESIEKDIINLKLHLLDYYFTFNSENIDFNYLISLHDFLFSDFYFKDKLKIRNLGYMEKEMIESDLKNLNKLCLSEPYKLEEILYLIKKIWYMQPFILGNTRTLFALLKILNENYLLGLDIDVDQNITNNSNIFELNNYVNQKRLTK